MSRVCHLDRKTDVEEEAEVEEEEEDGEQSAAVCRSVPCVLAHFRHISQRR